MSAYHEIIYVEHTQSYTKEWVTFCPHGRGDAYCSNCLARFICLTTKEDRMYIEKEFWEEWKKNNGMYMRACKFILNVSNVSTKHRASASA